VPGSLKLYVFLWVAQSDQILADSVSMVSLQHYLAVLCRSSTGAEILQFLGHSSQVRILVVDTINYCCWSAKLSSFKSYSNPLLLLFNLSASTQVFGKPACWTNFSHDAQTYKGHMGYIRFSNQSSIEQLHSLVEFPDPKSRKPWQKYYQAVLPQLSGKL
jgi:hypothetical protein